MSKIFSTIIVTLAVLGTVQASYADIRIKSRQTMGGQSYENLTMIKGKRQRTEMMNGVMVNITQCDLRRAIQLNPAAKTFVVNEFGEVEPPTASDSTKIMSQPNVKGGKVVTTISVKDTGERKQMFGMAARRLIITMDTQSSPESCTKNNSRMEIDGWYTDLAVGFDCDQMLNPRNISPKKASGGCQDQYVLRQTGAGKRGYPLYEKMTMFDESGKETMTMVNEVVELSKAVLDANLFDIPDGYREVQDISEMYAASYSQGVINDGSQSSLGMNSTSSMPLPNLEPRNGSGGNHGINTKNDSGDENRTPAKKEGAVRIGLVAVKTALAGEGITAADLSEAVKNTLIDYLKVPNLEVVLLDGKLVSAIDAEARNKECDFVLYATIAHKKGGGGFGGKFGSVLGSTIARTGIGHTGSTVGNIAGQIITQAAVSATTVSAQMKAKDEVTLDIKLTPAAGGQATAKQYKAKARSDGDDILTPVIEQAAQAIVNAVGR